jgi:multiple sugar transport system permease protein
MPHAPAVPREAYALLTPLTLFLLALLGLPLAVDLLYSVSRVTFETLRSPEPIGFANFQAVLADASFWRAMGFSLRFGLVVTVAEVGIGLVLAIFLAPLFSKAPTLISVLMLPMMVAPALVGLMYRLILHEFVGAVPYYLYAWLGDSPAFLGPDAAFWTLATIETLQWTPFAFLILYASYRSVAPAVREAAAIDGVNGWQELLHIDLPWMMPTIGIVCFIRFIDSFRVFDNVYVLTGAGAGGGTTTASIYIYEAFFRRNDIGVAVAASLVLLILSFVVLAVILRRSRRTA